MYPFAFLFVRSADSTNNFYVASRVCWNRAPLSHTVWQHIPLLFTRTEPGISPVRMNANTGHVRLRTCPPKINAVEFSNGISACPDLVALNGCGHFGINCTFHLSCNHSFLDYILSFPKQLCIRWLSVKAVVAPCHRSCRGLGSGQKGRRVWQRGGSTT